jgi:L,D-peptidoglycan transpeptidase YkuD (ErfK/YbiS/YcfS/YnhG family)
MVTVGDNGYPNGNQVNYGDLQQTGKNTSAIFGPSFWTVPSPTMPIFTIPGNHGVAGPTHTDLTTWTQDRVVATSGGRYQDDVYCCVNGTTSSHYASEWYAFTAGNARFYLLDAAWGNANVGTGTMYSDDYAAHWAPGSPEREWLAADLAAHPTQLKFAFFHYPLYVDNPTESSDTYLQGPDSLEGLLARNGVQMVFNGHAHLYERNTASAAGMPVSYVTGGGGGTLEPISGCTSIDAYGIGWSPGRSKGSACGAAATPTSAAQVYHFLKVTVSGGSVTVTPTNSLGQAFDVHRYDFGPPPPPDTWIDSGPAALTRETSATFTFHASGGSATFRCSLDGSAPTTCTSPVTYPGLGDGSHTFTAAATVAGIADPTPASSTWSVDTTPPPVPTGLTAAPSTTEIVLNWSPPSDGAGLAGYDVYRDGALAATAATPTWTDAQVPPGSHSYQVSALDDLGNESAKSDAVVAGLVVPPPVNPPPVSPPSGPRRIHLGGVAVRLPAGSRQVVTVNHAHRWHARVTLWQQAHGHWQRVARAHDGRIGQGGLVSARRHRQGRDDTPLGTYRLISAFGTHAAHRAWQLPYQQITSGDYWVRDNRSDFYNRYRNKADGGFRWWLPAQRVGASVPLAAHRREFEFVVVTSFNESQVRHRGAGIFLQVNAHRGTTGSVSAPRWFVRRTLGVLDPAMSPVIAVGR